MKRQTKFKFRLYIAGDTPNTALAVANLNALCWEHLPDRYEIEIVDVFREPERALEDSILMTPTLIKLSPSPLQTIVGTLSQSQAVLQTLKIGDPTA